MAPIPWNERNAAHLLRRAGFGGTAGDLAQALRDGLEATVDRLVDFETISTAALDQRLAALNLDLTTFGGINQWWMTRLLHSPRPLEERMTLFWHDHFATAISKVSSPPLMLLQNQLLRRFALGNFVEFAIAISKDPAMLIWLDNWTSRKEHPNENYGRELLELFTLGHEAYTEDDVMAASKAFTGWTLRRQQGQLPVFLFRDAWHDHSQKTFLGRTGDWNGDDIVRMACAEHAHGHLIVGKLFALFAYENPPHEIINPLVDVYLGSGTDLKALVRAILTSEEMYSEKALSTKVKSPVDHAVIAARQLLIDNDNLPRAARNPMAVQGQTLFNPPDVAGWDGGLSWISAGSLLTRMNFALALSAMFDPMRFVEGGTVTTAAQMVDLFLRRLGPVEVSPQTRDELVRYVSPGVLPGGNALVMKQRGLAHLILSLPEWQMY